MVQVLLAILKLYEVGMGISSKNTTPSMHTHTHTHSSFQRAVNIIYCVVWECTLNV